MEAGDSEDVRDAATVLPVAAALLLLPPVILIFAAPVLLAGIPLILAYVFGVWASIIVAAFLIARRCNRAALGSSEGHLAPTRDRP